MDQLEPARPIVVVGAAVFEDGRVLAARRGPGMSLPGQWEFPGGKVEPGEAPQAALAREVAEELGIEIEVLESLGQGRSLSESGQFVVLEVFAARRIAGEVAPVEHSEHRWCGPFELHRLDWAEADRPLLLEVERRLMGPAGTSEVPFGSNTTE